MVDEKKERPDNRTDQPPEKPKKLPAAFPKKFDSEQKAKSGNKKRGNGARLHGSM